MAEITLHSYRRCPFAIRVRVTLHEKEVPFDVIEEDLDHPSAELLRLHPEGLVPLLIHRMGGKTMTLHESAVITEYLDERFPEPRLMPAAPEARAEARLWTYWCNHLFKPDVDRFKYEDRAAATGSITAHLAKLEEALAHRAFLVGDALTLADIHVFPFLRQLARVTPAHPELGRFPAATAWLERMTSRESFRRAMRVSN